MNKEMDELLTRLDELLMEAHEKGYTFVFSQLQDDIEINLYSANDEGFGIGIEEW